MQETFLQQLAKRVKSLLWRAGAVAAMACLGYVLDNVGMLELPMWITTALGLVLGEVTKYLNAGRK